MLMDQPPSLRKKSDRLLLLNSPRLRLLRKRRLKPSVRRKVSSEKEKDVDGLGRKANMVMDTNTAIDTEDPTPRRKKVQDLDPATRRKSS